MMGSRKAAVFPDPVCEQAITSSPSKINGMAYFWMGVGLSYFDSFTFFIIRSPRLSSSNELKQVHISSPLQEMA